MSGANKLFIIFQDEKKNFLCTSHVVHSVYSTNTNKLPNHFTLLLFYRLLESLLTQRCDSSCNFSNCDLFKCEDNMFSCQRSPGILIYNRMLTFSPAYLTHGGNVPKVNSSCFFLHNIVVMNLLYKSSSFIAVHEAIMVFNTRIQHVGK